MNGRCIVRHFHLAPLHSQGIALSDVGIALEWQKVDVVMDDAFGFCHHLTLRNP